MTIDELRSEYKSVRSSDKFIDRKNFANKLMSSNDIEFVEYHYDLIKDRDNKRVYYLLRHEFAKRDADAQQFLLAQLQTEEDPVARADILHLLGRMRNPAALPLAREALTAEDADLRHRGCYILGWMGKSADIDLLGQRLTQDPDAFVRGTAATAHRQVWYRSSRTKDRLLRNLKLALESEEEEEVILSIIITAQTIMKKRFGIKEDMEEDELVGDAVAAKEKCMRALDKLKL